jgi:cytochrome c oxidase assembly protein subunit 15
VALLWWTFARTARGHLARIAAVSAVAFTVIEAALGAFLVKLGLTAQSRSPLRAPYLALHLANTLLLLAALTLTAHLLSRRTGYLRGRIRITASFGAIGAIVVVLIVGVTGSLAALGDTLYPVSSLGAALVQETSQRRVDGSCDGVGRIRPSRLWRAFFSSGCWFAPRSGQRIGTIGGSQHSYWCF